MGEPLHIPTFAAGASGPFLPATAIKGALRTGMLFANWRDGMLQDVLGRVKGERAPRRPAESVEEQALGPAGSTRMRLVSAGDSVKIYLLRTSTLMPRGANFALGWKRSPSGSVDGARPDDSTPAFAEMANPGTTFHGVWDEKAFFFQPDVRRSVRWPESFNRAKIFESVNVYAAGLLALQRNYAAMAGMGLLDKNLDELEQRLAAAVASCAWVGAAACRLKSPGSTPPTPTTARSWNNSRSTTAPWRRISPSLNPPHRVPGQPPSDAAGVGGVGGRRLT